MTHQPTLSTLGRPIIASIAARLRYPDWNTRQDIVWWKHTKFARFTNSRMEELSPQSLGFTTLNAEC